MMIQLSGKTFINPKHVSRVRVSWTESEYHIDLSSGITETIHYNPRHNGDTIYDQVREFLAKLEQANG